MTAEELAGAAGIVLSLGMSYIPGLNVRFADFNPTEKRLIVFALLVLVAGVVFAIGCLPESAGAAALGLVMPECSRAGAWGLLRILVTAVVMNQVAYAISPRQSEVAKIAGLAKYKKSKIWQQR